jgi:hypothetical protein
MPPKRRRILIINKRFQFRFAFYVCTWLFALSFIYPLIVDNIFTFFIRFIAADPASTKAANLIKIRNDVLVLLIGMQLVFLGLSFLISIFMSHRIAGPIYKIRKFLTEAREARGYPQKLSFREKDYFLELAQDYNGMVEEVQGRLKKNADGIADAIQRIEKVLPQLEGTQSTSEAHRELTTVLETLKSVPPIPADQAGSENA